MIDSQMHVKVSNKTIDPKYAQTVKQESAQNQAAALKRLEKAVSFQSVRTSRWGVAR